MPLKLRDHLHWCDCAGRIIFLDIDADRYFSLPATTAAAFRKLAAGAADTRDERRLQALVYRGMLLEVEGSAEVEPAASVEPPTHDYLPAAAPPARLLDVARALLSELLLMRALRTRSFRDIIEAMRNSSVAPSRRSSDPHRSLASVAAAANAVGLVIRAHDRCLIRALSAYSLCHRQGLTPKLVFGVIPHPFEAHCWVQLGSAVLVGGYEQARLFTPILVLG